jgi:hypothetical protein
MARMETAIRLNEIIVEQSSTAQLVIINMPSYPTKKDEQDELHCILFCCINCVLYVIKQRSSRIVVHFRSFRIVFLTSTYRHGLSRCADRESQSRVDGSGQRARVRHHLLLNGLCLSSWPILSNCCYYSRHSRY